MQKLLTCSTGNFLFMWYKHCCQIILHDLAQPSLASNSRGIFINLHHKVKSLIMVGIAASLDLTNFQIKSWVHSNSYKARKNKCI